MMKVWAGYISSDVSPGPADDNRFLGFYTLFPVYCPFLMGILVILDKSVQQGLHFNPVTSKRFYFKIVILCSTEGQGFGIQILW